jgi:hypothetical protein
MAGMGQGCLMGLRFRVSKAVLLTRKSHAADYFDSTH